MRYGELLEFEPITTVIKLVETDAKDRAQHLVKTYVFSPKMVEDITNVLIYNTVLGANYETKAVQVIGTYGSGKSHLMAVFSAIAEDASLLEFVGNKQMQRALESIAGKFCVLRFEIASQIPLYEFFWNKVLNFLAQLGINFTPQGKDWKEDISSMLEAFRAKYPDKGFLVVIDEILDYLRSRVAQELYSDLVFLRVLGESCDRTNLRLIIGVQEQLFTVPEFVHVADTLNKVEARFSNITITREDLSFVVKERLLKKTESQKEIIRKHLNQFAPFFSDIHSHLQDFVELFPVHRNYIPHFESIRYAKNQREVLKVLSQTFEQWKEKEVPEKEPGLLTYDTYWEEIRKNPNLLSIPEIRQLKERVEQIYERIDSHFVHNNYSKYIPLAKAITNALAIKVLGSEWGKINGANAEMLKEDLCLTLELKNSKMITQWINVVASKIKEATQAQFVDQDAKTSDYYIKVEGGINPLHHIKLKAAKELRNNPARADEHFYAFLQEILGLTNKVSTPNSKFHCYEDNLEWKSTKAFRQGYLLLGNSTDRPTTLPFFHYYLIFLPIFQEPIITPSPKEIYFDFSLFKEVQIKPREKQLEELGTSGESEETKKGQDWEELKRKYAQQIKQPNQELENLFLNSKNEEIISLQKNLKLYTSTLESIAEQMLANEYLPDAVIGVLEDTVRRLKQGEARKEEKDKIKALEDIIGEVKNQVDYFRNELDTIVMYGEEFREPIRKFTTLLLMYGAARELAQTAPLQQKQLYEVEKKRYLEILKNIFDKEYREKTQVIIAKGYKEEKGDSVLDTEITILKEYELAQREEGFDIFWDFREVAAQKLDTYFNQAFPYYPRFKDLRRPLRKDNYAKRIYNALEMIIPIKSSNDDGIAILKGLGLLTSGERGYEINTTDSIYAQSIRKKLEERGANGVLNPSDVFEPVPQTQGRLWQTKDEYKLELELGFLVICAMVKVGELEIHLDTRDNKINALNLKEVLNWQPEQYRNFVCLAKPKDVSIEGINKILRALGLSLEVSQLKDLPYMQAFQQAIKSFQEQVLKTIEEIRGNINCRGYEFFDKEQIEGHRRTLAQCSNYLDQLKTYNEYHKFKNFQLDAQDFCAKIEKAKELMQYFDWLKKWAQKIGELLRYLSQAESYLPSSQAALKNSIQEQITMQPQKWQEILANKVTAEDELVKWEALLNSLKQQYVKYYYDSYLQHHITEQEEAEKQQLLKSEEKKIADALSRLEFVPNQRYVLWNQQIERMKVRDLKVTEARIMQEPYLNFNPKEYEGKSLPKVQEFAAQLKEIIEDWQKTLRGLLLDPKIRENMDLLLESWEKELLLLFEQGKAISSAEEAKKIGVALAKAMQPIEKINVELEKFAQELQGPLTPEEIEKRVRNWLNKLCAGKERDKVRIMIR
ncbi:MAG: DUF6079 family protein [Bacteroidia bacterium]|nr:DUF6079 family protein [Bacteroidia bacterium]MDW8158449.1 DUF6079 family protein [Bacteroidia bacterium]